MTRERLAVLSHELRSPVAALAALTERADASVPKETMARVIALAIAAGRDVERLLSDPDLLSMRPVEIDLRDLLAGVARPGVSVAAEPVVVVCDPTRVRQAVGNLVANGLRHGTRVTVDARRNDDRVVIDVRDDGPGIDPAVDPFDRGVSTTGSTGYGLWLARLIAEGHGGSLELTSAPGRGAAFTLFLPLASDGRG